MNIETLKDELRKFNVDRDWDKYHNPKDLFIALVSEVGELADCFRWLNADEVSNIYTDLEKRKKIEDEIADIIWYLLILGYKTDMDILEALANKIERNKKRYPVEEMKGQHSNKLVGFKAKDIKV